MIGFPNRELEQTAHGCHPAFRHNLYVKTPYAAPSFQKNHVRGKGISCGSPSRDESTVHGQNAATIRPTAIAAPINSAKAPIFSRLFTVAPWVWPEAYSLPNFRPAPSPQGARGNPFQFVFVALREGASCREYQRYRRMRLRKYGDADCRPGTKLSLHQNSVTFAGSYGRRKQRQSWRLSASATNARLNVGWQVSLNLPSSWSSLSSTKCLNGISAA